MMRTVGDSPEGLRLRALVVILWRAGLRISEALALAESDLDSARGAVLVRRGKGGRRREVGMDRWGWEQLRPWLELRASLPVGSSLCVLVSVAGSLHISSGTLTRSRWRAKGSRSPSFSANMPIWA